MADAFRCDECDEYFDGDPVEQVYSKDYHMGQASYDLRAELCKGCSDGFAGGPDSE